MMLTGCVGEQMLTTGSCNLHVFLCGELSDRYQMRCQVSEVNELYVLCRQSQEAG